MAKIQILGQLDCVTEDKLLAVAEQIQYGSSNVALALASKQDSLTFDSTPTQSSTNPVTSGGLYTKLNQMDSDLREYVDSAASAANVTLHTVTIANTGWVLNDGTPRYDTNLLPSSVETKKYYDVHLAVSTSSETSILCAKSDIRVVVESNGLYLRAYNATAETGWTSDKPSFNFDIEIIVIPITSDVTGLSYDIGDDFVINVTQSLDNKITAVENGLGTSSDTASATGTTAWSRLKQAQTDITSIQTSIGTESDDASSSSNVVWPRLKSTESDVTGIKSSLGTSSDTASATGTTAWSRVKQAESDITSIKISIGTASDAASSSSNIVWPRLRSIEDDVADMKLSLGTSSDIASPTGTTAWSRINQAESDVDTLENNLSALQTSVSTLENDKVNKLILCAVNKSVAISAWSNSEDPTYLFKADVTMNGLDASYFPIVQFDDADIATFSFGPTVTPKTNAITIYCKTKPSRVITIPNIICFKGTSV